MLTLPSSSLPWPELNYTLERVGSHMPRHGLTQPPRLPPESVSDRDTVP